MKTAKEIFEKHKKADCYIEYSEKSILAAIQEGMDEVEIKSRLDAIEIAKEIFEDYKIAYPETYNNDYNITAAIQAALETGYNNDYDMQCPFCESSDTKYYNTPSGKCNDCNKEWALLGLNEITKIIDEATK